MIKPTVRVGIAFLAAALLSGQLTIAQSAAVGTVSGQVTVVGGFLARARVVISSTGDTNYTGNSTTDENGKFNFASVPVGTIAIKLYDTQSNLLKTVGGTLASAGDVLNLAIQVP